MPWARAAASSPGHTSDGRRRLMIVRTPSRARFAIPASSGCAPRNNAGFTQPKFPMPSQAGTPRGMMLQPEKISAPRKTPSNDTKRAQDKGGKGSMSRKVVVETEREEARLLIPREYKDTKKTEWIVHCPFLDSNSLPDPFSNSNSGSTVKRVNRSSPKPLPLKIQFPISNHGPRSRRTRKPTSALFALLLPCMALAADVARQDPPAPQLDAAAILRELTDFSVAGVSRRLGPDYDFYHPGSGDQDFPDIYLVPMKSPPPEAGPDIKRLHYQLGGPWTKDAGDFSSTQGQILYVPDRKLAVDRSTQMPNEGIGVDRVTIIEMSNGCFTEKPEPPWWGGFRPDPTAKAWLQIGRA